MRKLTNKSKTVRTGLAIILVLLLIAGSALSTLAAPKHDNFNQTARDAVKRAGGKGIENSNNPNSALHGNGDQTEVVVEEDDKEVEKDEEENDETQDNDGKEQKKNPVNEIDEDNEKENNDEDDESSEEVVVETEDENGEEEEEASEENTNGDNTQNSDTSPGEVIEIQALQIPEGAVNLNSINIIDTEVPQSAPDLDRVIILDEEVPQSAPSLPQTGDANPLIMVITGLGMAASGLSIRSRQRYTTSSVTTLFQDK